MDPDVQRSAERLTELEREYGTAPSPELGPLSKRVAEERDALAAMVQHPASRKGHQ